MFGFHGRAKNNAALLKALDKSLAIIEFDLKGTILSANANICRMFGYKPEEIVGKHHSICVDADYARSAEYREFWERLGRGESLTHEVKRIGKGGAEVWVQTSYHPVLDSKGVVRRDRQRRHRHHRGQGEERRVRSDDHRHFARPGGDRIHSRPARSSPPTPISSPRSGYTLDEIKGRHHRMLVEPAYAASPEYQAFWAKLNAASRRRHVCAHRQGRPQSPAAGLLQPDLRYQGRVVKVVKFASDMSDLIELGAALSRLAQNDLEQPIEQTVPADVRRDPARLQHRAGQSENDACSAFPKASKRFRRAPRRSRRRRRTFRIAPKSRRRAWRRPRARSTPSPKR